MIIVGAGTNHWYHSDTIYRCMLLLTTITGCGPQRRWLGPLRRSGEGPSHHREAQMAFGLDWVRPPRQMIQTAYWYMHTDQYRYDHYTADTMAGPTGTGLFDGMSTADQLALSTRLGWMPSYPTFNRNPLDLADEAEAAGQPIGDYVVEQAEVRGPALRRRGPGRSGELAARPDDVARQPLRLLGQGQRVLPQAPARHRQLGVGLRDRRGRPPEGRAVAGRGARGKLDLLYLDFRMTSSTIFSDVVLPAATWYEKHDINTTDMHPFIHSFNPAISPPWQTKTDWDIFQAISEAFSPLGAKHLGVRKDVVAAPLLHDTPEAMATPHGRVLDWKKGECEPVPGKTMPKLVVWSGTTAPSSTRWGARAAHGEGSARCRRASPTTSSARWTTCATRTAPSAAAWLTAVRRSGRTPTSPRRSWRSRAPPTATSPPRASRPWRSAPAS